MGIATSQYASNTEDKFVFTADEDMTPLPPNAVIANVYDVHTHFTVANNLLNAANNFVGAFHCGIEVHGKEWSFGNGVYEKLPRELPGYRKSIILGVTPLSREKVVKLVSRESAFWPGDDYDVLSHNCIDFCQRVTELLGVDPLPAWIGRLPTIGSTLIKNSARAAEQLESLKTDIGSWMLGGWISMRDDECMNEQNDASPALAVDTVVMYFDGVKWVAATVTKSQSRPKVRICITYPELTMPSEGIWVDFPSRRIEVPIPTGVGYKKDDWVQYLSDAYGCYLYAQVVEVRGEEVKVSVKNEFLSKMKQQLRLRHSSGRIRPSALDSGHRRVTCL